MKCELFCPTFSLHEKVFHTNGFFLSFWKLNFFDKKQDLIKDLICIRIIFERIIQL